MGPLEELLGVLEEKLDRARRMIDEYDESMDYANYCTLQGFAEGLALAIEEIKERVGKTGPTGDE